MSEDVKKGDYVQVHYTGTLDDGKTFDSSQGKEPLAVIAGEGMLIKGFDEALVGMKDGEEKEISLKPEEAYGEANPALKQPVPRDQLGPEMKPEVGMVLGIKAPTGQVFPATVVEVKDDEIILDANHPLAGKTLHFKLKVESHREATQEDRSKIMNPHAGHEHGEGCGCDDPNCECDDECNCEKDDQECDCHPKHKEAKEEKSVE